ncbi:MAG: PHP domain-containing protein [Chloroflexota bacterium]
MGKADLHVHTTYSKDATTTVRGVLKQASLKGLHVIAIADHDEIRGSLEARELASQYNVEVVPGVEVSTQEGHLLALYVDRPMPKGLPMIDTLIRIGDFGGIAIAPHPMNRLPGSLGMEAIVAAMADEKAQKVLKGIEVYNMGHEIFNEDAQKYSLFLPLSQVAASDSHVYWTVGAGHTEFPGYTAADLRVALENFATVAVPAEYKFTLRPLFSWAGHMLLRKLGYVSENHAPQEPVRIQRISYSPAGDD